MSIRVDPLDVAAVRKAIVKLRDAPDLCRDMAYAALQRSKLFDVDERARHILAFMAAKIHDSPE